MKQELHYSDSKLLAMSSLLYPFLRLLHDFNNRLLAFHLLLAQSQAISYIATGDNFLQHGFILAFP